MLLLLIEVLTIYAKHSDRGLVHKHIYIYIYIYAYVQDLDPSALRIYIYIYIYTTIKFDVVGAPAASKYIQIS